MFKFPYCPPQNVLHRKKLVKAHRSYVLVENYNWENRLKKNGNHTIDNILS